LGWRPGRPRIQIVDAGYAKRRSVAKWLDFNIILRGQLERVRKSREMESFARPADGAARGPPPLPLPVCRHSVDRGACPFSH
jgi:hypothetical protein